MEDQLKIKKLKSYVSTLRVVILSIAVSIVLAGIALQTAFPNRAPITAPYDSLTWQITFFLTPFLLLVTIYTVCNALMVNIKNGETLEEKTRLHMQWIILSCFLREIAALGMHVAYFVWIPSPFFMLGAILVLLSLWELYPTTKAVKSQLYLSAAEFESLKKKKR